MDPIAIIAVAFFATTALIVTWTLQRWASKRIIKRIVDEALANPDRKPQLIPESQYIVDISDIDVRCSRPDGTIESISWNDLQLVEIHTTDEGPFLPDVFWVLHGSDGGCIIPQGATGEAKLLESLQALPQFRDEAMIDAMSSAENNRFVCWQRSEKNA
ncbi:hypothetical protein [Rubinisphaera margarita]|uniref:hypothetical protein n=1 Tax=Rubinisphaera margarita TaxID=2909586 RepID=UPI001EE8A270|nr:hypothetical protein [Rubinisphaera margarita]MCG6154301.1 hypothetical protein [Rubinisphaera margarita]